MKFLQGIPTTNAGDTNNKNAAGSECVWRHQTSVENKIASISDSVRDIWTKFGTELKHRTAITLEYIHVASWKSTMAAAAILNFGNCPYLQFHELICAKFGVKMHHHGHTMTKKSKQKSLRVTTWNNNASIWDYKRDIWINIGT